ncbi:MAG TPA: tetratricopeptide repeat protein [Anaerolineae bacterium]|nr:tetratricopeptide repeat protein [Anaerolineae bacterium]
MEERERLEQTIGALEAQRAMLGDVVVDTALAPLREKLAALTPPASDLVGERKRVTILLADVKGSTDLAERLSIETWVEVMNHLLKLLSAEVYRYGGEVNQYRGDGLLAFFGVATAHEDDPERAILAALAMQAVVRPYAAELAEREGVELWVRVGINTGEVIVTRVGDWRQHSEDTAMGRAVALAARMETSAEPGAVLVAEPTYRLARAQFEWQSLGAITVKGFQQPIHVYRPLRHHPAPGKSRGIPGLVAPLVGRQAELRALQTAVERLREGVGGIAILVGEAGLGKSRMIAELRQWMARFAEWPPGETPAGAVAPASAPPLCWIEGRCVSYGASSAYMLWLDVLRELLGLTPDYSSESAQDGLAQELSRIFPDTAAQIAPVLAHLLTQPAVHASPQEALAVPEEAPATRYVDGESLKTDVLGAVEQVLATAAGRSPLIIVCEDLHWADPTSLDLLTRLFPLTAQTPLLLICILRPEPQPLCAHLREAAAPYRPLDLNLAPLSSAESLTLVTHLLRVNGLPPQFWERILGYSEGNPFYIEELLRALLDGGSLVYDEAGGYWRMAQDAAVPTIPDTLHGVLAARIDRLPSRTKRVLQLAAVIGRIFAYRVLETLWLMESGAESGAGETLDAHLSLLEQTTLLRERPTKAEFGFSAERTYIFKHYLTQQAAYYSLLERERRAIHQQVAEALKQLHPRQLFDLAELLAYHWECAGEPGRALPHLLRAVDKAAFRFADAETLDYLERAAQAAQAAHLTLAEADVHVRFNYIFRRQGDYVAAHAHLEQALTIYQGFGNQRRVGEILTELGVLARRQGEYVEAAKYFEQTLQISRLVGNRHGEAAALNHLGTIARSLGRYVAAQRHFEQALRLSQALHNGWEEGAALLNLGIVLRHLGDTAGAETCFVQALALYQRLHDRIGEGMTLAAWAALAHMQGDDGTALAHAQPALSIADEIGDRSQQGYVLTVLGRAFVGLGQWQQAKKVYGEAMTLRHKLGEHHLALESLAGLVEVAVLQDDLTQARRWVNEILAAQSEGNPAFYGADDPFQVYLTCYEVLRRAGDPRAGAVLSEARRHLQAQAAELVDAAQRRSFLEKVPAHSKIMQAWDENNVLKFQPLNVTTAEEERDDDDETMVWDSDCGDCVGGSFVGSVRRRSNA